MTWTFCTSGQAIAKAGANISTAISQSGQILADWNDEAESVICDIARVDLVTKYSSLTTNGKVILGDLCSSLMAQQIIRHETDNIGLNSSITRLNVLENNIRRNIGLIEDDKVKTYLGAT